MDETLQNPLPPSRDVRSRRSQRRVFVALLLWFLGCCCAFAQSGQLPGWAEQTARRYADAFYTEPVENQLSGPSVPIPLPSVSLGRPYPSPQAEAAATATPGSLENFRDENRITFPFPTNSVYSAVANRGLESQEYSGNLPERALNQPGDLTGLPQRCALPDTLPEQLDPNHDFSPTPLPFAAETYDAAASAGAYDNKHAVPTQRPWIEWGMPFYGGVTPPPGDTTFGFYNQLRQKFYLYGDWRTGIGGGRNVAGGVHNIATRLNLEADWQLTATERFHGSFQPLTQGVQFTRLELGENGPTLIDELNPNFVTGFFEGDLGSMMGGISDTPAPIDLPISIGLLPLFYQNGIWMDDAVVGAAVALPFQHSNLLNWSNFDASVFVGVNQVNSPVFGTDTNDGHILGTAWFIDAYDGYIEAGWAYVRDHAERDQSYHNIGLAFTRRYFSMINNSVRGIFNFGQSLPQDQRTADGALILVENSLISPLPLQLVPYLNGFVGIDRPQSVARAVQAGGILRNTGINFETDGLNGYPTLDADANNTYGGAVGVSWLGLGLDRQIALEAACVRGYGDRNERVVPGDEFGIGSRLQLPLNHATLIRFDAMYGWREGNENVWGTRLEWRWKF